jgi:hypothetical protein
MVNVGFHRIWEKVEMRQSPNRVLHYNYFEGRKAMVFSHSAFKQRFLELERIHSPGNIKGAQFQLNHGTSAEQGT